MPKESDHIYAASGKLEEKAKQVESLQRKLKDLEDQNRDLQKNVRMCIHTTVYCLMLYVFH